MTSIDKIREMGREYSCRALPAGVTLQKYLGDARRVVRNGRRNQAAITDKLAKVAKDLEAPPRAVKAATAAVANFTQQQQYRKSRKELARQLPGYAAIVAEKLNAMGIQASAKSPLRLARNLSFLTGGTKNSVSRERAIDLFRAFMSDSIRLKGHASVVLPAVPQPKVERTGFYWSREWRDLRYRRIKASGGKCQACGRGKKDGSIIHIDHIKPRSKYPELELDFDNTQVLCDDCNLGKSNTDETDWRE